MKAFEELKGLNNNPMNLPVAFGARRLSVRRWAATAVCCLRRSRDANPL
jgi:hypothetical protein